MNAEPPPLQGEISDRLTDLFGTRFSFWNPRTGWTVENSTAAGEAATDEAKFLAILNRREPVVESLSATSCRLWLPIPISARRSILGVGTIDDGSVIWIQRLAEQFLRSFALECERNDLHDQVQAAMSQISQDLEHHAFLRFLAEQIEICEVTRQIDYVLRQVLPRLQRSIEASCVTFVPRDAFELADDDCWITIGELPIKPIDGCNLIGRYDIELYKGPVVKNRNFSAPNDELPPGVNNFMMVAVEKDDSHLGWLLAFNRAPNDLVEEELDNGFGTVEAGLIQVSAFLIATHGRNVEIFQESEALTIGVVRSLVSAIEARDSYTRGHSERVALVAKRIAEAFGAGPEEVDTIYISGLLHDVGKIGIADEVLRKPGALTKEEFDEIKKHPQIGYTILKGIPRITPILPGVLYHHERMDGKGYPEGLSGPDIPLIARILAVADGWDAMTSARPYRNPIPHEKAISILSEGKGTQWDPVLVDIAIALREELIDISQHHAGGVGFREPEFAAVASMNETKEAIAPVAEVSSP